MIWTSYLKLSFGMFWIAATVLDGLLVYYGPTNAWDKARIPHDVIWIIYWFGWAWITESFRARDMEIATLKCKCGVIGKVNRIAIFDSEGGCILPREE